MSKEDITQIESLSAVQLLNQMYKEMVQMKVELAKIQTKVDSLCDRSKDFGNETFDIHMTCQKRYEKCNERFENLAVKQSTDFGKLESQVKLLIGKYGTICIIVSSVLTGLVVKYIS